MDGFATRLQGQQLLKARQINELPYILFKDGAIRINSIKLYRLILLTLLYIADFTKRSSERCIYKNKWKKKVKVKKLTQFIINWNNYIK